MGPGSLERKVAEGLRRVPPVFCVDVSRVGRVLLVIASNIPLCCTSNTLDPDDDLYLKDKVLFLLPTDTEHFGSITIDHLY